MKNIRSLKKDAAVLVGVLKNKRDLDLFLKYKWYRIPKAYAPVKSFLYIAPYQPVVFGRQGKRIKYYAEICNIRTLPRIRLIPDEMYHPRAHDDYLRIDVKTIKKLPRPIKNIIPRRISFGFTTLNRLLTSKDVLELYNVAPTEQMIGDALKRSSINVINQYYIKSKNKRYFLDFAIRCKNGDIAIECDNKKAHSGKRQRNRDKIKDIFLRQSGWTVIRLRERDIISDINCCIMRIKKAIRKLGGLQ